MKVIRKSLPWHKEKPDPIHFVLKMKWGLDDGIQKLIVLTHCLQVLKHDVRKKKVPRWEFIYEEFNKKEHEKELCDQCSKKVRQLLKKQKDQSALPSQE